MLHWLTKLFKKNDSDEIDGVFFRPIFFVFPNALKESVASEMNMRAVGKDYLSKNKNIEKYIYEACEELQVYGISYKKYVRDLKRYSDDELNKRAGKIVGRDFEIEARLMLRRAFELYLESWYFKEITSDKEKAFRYFFLIKNLMAFHSRKSNTEKFCEIKSEFDTKVIDEIRNELDKISVSDMFYLKKGKNYTIDNHVKDLTESTFKLFEGAVSKLAAAPRAMVGESYQMYAETSNVIHGYSGGPKFKLEDYHKELSSLYGRIAILASNVLKHLVVIGDDIIGNDDIKKAIGELATDKLPNSLSIEIGDKVLVLREVKAEVVEISASDYGCKKYKVKYEDKRGNWNWSFEREWFLLKDLQKVSN